MPDHVLVSGNDEGGLREEEEKADGLERMDGVAWQATVKVIDEYDQRLGNALQDFLELSPERGDLLGGALLRVQEGRPALLNVFCGRLCRLDVLRIAGAADDIAEGPDAALQHTEGGHAQRKCAAFDG